MSKKLMLFVCCVLSVATANGMEEKDHDKALRERVQELERKDRYRAAEISTIRNELIALQDKYYREKQIAAGFALALVLQNSCVIL